MNTIKQESNSATTLAKAVTESTTIKTTLRESTSLISHTIIGNEGSKHTSEFIKFSPKSAIKSDWVSKKAFIEISASIITLEKDGTLEYPLKKAYAGNKDEGKEPSDGKAVKISLQPDTISIKMYKQAPSKPWEFSHTHIIERSIFEAYMLVFSNTAKTEEWEKEQQSPKHFSLNLG